MISHLGYAFCSHGSSHAGDVLQLDVMLCMPAPATRALHTWQVSTDSHGWLQMGCTVARACGVRHGSLWSSMENP